MGDIEFSDVHLGDKLPEEDEKQDMMPSYNSMDDLRQLESSQGVMKILHLQGRPDMSNVINEAIQVQKRLDADGSLGVFVCGPTAMSNAIDQAIDAGGESVCLYKEVFEF